MRTIFYLLAIYSIFAGCNQKPKELTQGEKEKYLLLGDSIANVAQSVLLKNVSQQIKNNGIESAIEFCNEKAMVITDSLSFFNKVEINRLTDKSRNIKNKIYSEEDKKVWDELLTMNTNHGSKHLIAQQGETVYYYKAIPLGMPTCLSCHGSKETEIIPQVQKIITAKYPQDKAVDYKMGELRGMWKIKLK